ncbi:carboxypeptidase-like regulatory domain-containing protein [Pseudosporangium ferrugineum]|uniref:Carboxypeptidase family protein n=1 Tax=Pseudosporangium ferrugineum TaxID=439699 RepID=A0A2T0RIT5_9ACTN|nr:carboxypeptidase-like regulatory domain-containing protein [Pseudosporangium ferrugineum]PRY21032.1 carboxypeptidase family protein [Pseudosporangium ferrugineum]
MTTRLRARWARAAAVAALIGGVFVVAEAPATAAPQVVRLLSVSKENMRPGDSVRVKFRVTNPGRAPESAYVLVSGGLRCTTGCEARLNLGAGRSQTFQATLVAPQVDPGMTGLNIAIGVHLAGQNHMDYKMVYVYSRDTPLPGGGSGEDEPDAGVARVSGRVRDADGEALRGAAVTVRDAKGHKYTTTSDRNGRFAIKSSPDRTIAEGSITVVATLDGYRTARTTVRGNAGDTATVRLTLTAKAAPTTKPPASATADPLAAAGTAEQDQTPPASPPPTLKAVSGEGPSTTWLLLGGLLVAAGLGALVLLILRRRNAPEEQPAPAPAATQLMAPVGASLGDAPTAVLRTGPPHGGFPQPGHDPYR